MRPITEEEREQRITAAAAAYSIHDEESEEEIRDLAKSMLAAADAAVPMVIASAQRYAAEQIPGAAPGAWRTSDARP